MSEQNQPIDITEDIEVVGPGQMLREAREAKGLSQQDVATHLNFRLALVNELETEAFDASTPGTFIRGYLRNYAKFLGIDEKDILASYETLGVARQQRDEMKSFSQSTAKKAENKLLMVTSSVLATVMLGFSAYHFILEDTSDPVATVSAPTAEIQQASSDAATDGLESMELVSDADSIQSVPQEAEVVEQTDTVSTTPTEHENEPVDPNSVAESELSAPETAISPINLAAVARVAETDQSTEVTAQVPGVEQGSEPLALTKAELKFVFTGDCWVNIFDADGNRLAWGIKKNDYVMTLTGKPPFSVTLGKPELVQMTYQGEEISLAQYKVGQIAKLTVPEPIDEEAAE
ncbi:RodZ domain-containing protein [Thalassotalea litorea]|uniref:RodZ domain-containing protein n=1 Tax=Thalassotalea litorea TaxID=2020715 RepID=UPI003736D66E